MAEADNCITESKSTALDVRILKVAEWLASVRRSMLSRDGYSGNTSTIGEAAAALQCIAAELRAAATPPRATTPAPSAVDHLQEAILASFTEARTDSDLSDAWGDAAPSLGMLSLAERQTITEVWITRMCVVCQDDGQ